MPSHGLGLLALIHVSSCHRKGCTIQEIPVEARVHKQKVGHVALMGTKGVPLFMVLKITGKKK